MDKAKNAKSFNIHVRFPQLRTNIASNNFSKFDLDLPYFDNVREPKFGDDPLKSFATIKINWSNEN